MSYSEVIFTAEDLTFHDSNVPFFQIVQMSNGDLGGRATFKLKNLTIRNITLEAENLIQIDGFINPDFEISISSLTVSDF